MSKVDRTAAPTHARTRDGVVREIKSLEFAAEIGAVVLTFTDGTRTLARECTPRWSK